MKVKEVLRRIRDVLYRYMYKEDTTEIFGVRLKLKHPAISARMFHVLTHNYEIEEVELVKKWISSEDSVIEAGCAVGLVAIYCISKIGVENYTLVEANPEIRDLLSENFSLNGLQIDRYPFYSAALSASDGSIEFLIHENFWSSSVASRTGNERPVRIRAISLPSILNEISYKPTTLIMDIEGGEIEIPVWQLTAFRKLIIETHARVVGEENVKRLLSEIENAGFVQREIMDTTYVFENLN